MKNAIIVPGHAILKDLEDVEADSSWFLLGYQKGEPRFYIEHIRAAVEMADGESAVILSGGYTRPGAPRSEAEGYRLVAGHFGWFGKSRVCAVTEEHARDSFENVLFGVARFRQHFGRLPEHVTVCGWEFKRQRFDMHRAAIGWPAGRFRYIGVNDPDDLALAEQHEALTRDLFAADPRGEAPILAAKRRTRDPLGRNPPYDLSGL